MVRKSRITNYLPVLLIVLIIFVLSGCSTVSDQESRGPIMNDSQYTAIDNAVQTNTAQLDEPVPGVEYSGPVYIDNACLNTKCPYDIKEFDSRVKRILKVYSDPGFEGYEPNLKVSQGFNVYCANGTSDYRYIYFVFRDDECVSIADIYYNHETSDFSEVYSDFMGKSNTNDLLQTVTDCYKSRTEFYLYNYNQFQIYLVTSDAAYRIDGIEWNRELELINPAEPEKQAIVLNKLI